jgi:Cof subfamily protein (haloacid dehalogenase superfamily)
MSLGLVRRQPRLVALDLDGTLLGSDLRLRPRVLQAVRRMQERGVQGCLVTGRMYRATLPFARELRFSAPLICYQGAAVFDPASGQRLLDMPLPSEQALTLNAYAHRNDLHVQLYANDNYYCEERNRYSDLYAKISGVEPTIVPSLARQFAGVDATKCCIIAEPEIVARHLPLVRDLCGDRAYVTRSIPWFLEVMNANVNKGTSLALVASGLGIALGEVMAVGDSWNDAPLLEAAGFAVAMGSAPKELVAVADALVGDVEHDGVAEAIERYVLS